MGDARLNPDRGQAMYSAFVCVSTIYAPFFLFAIEKYWFAVPLSVAVVFDALYGNIVVSFENRSEELNKKLIIICGSYIAVSLVKLLLLLFVDLTVHHKIAFVFLYISIFVLSVFWFTSMASSKPELFVRRNRGG